MRGAVIVDVGVTVDVGVYAADDNIGGKLSITEPPITGRGVRLVGVQFLVHDAEATLAPTIYLFDANPAAATLTNNAGFVLTDPDREKLIYAVTPAAVKDPPVTGVGSIYAARGLDIPIPSTVLVLYVAIVAGGAITFSATDDAHLRLFFEQF